MASLISVVLPVYNVSKYIRRCINSILGQTFSMFELIIVDDGSTDDSLDICNKYRVDSRVTILHKENAGLSSARNFGIDYAKSKYVVFIDSDDWIHPDFLSKLYKLVNEYKADIAQVGFIATQHDTCSMSFADDSRITIMDGVEAVKKSCKYPSNIKYNITWNKIYRKCLFDEIKFPEGKIYEDEFTTYRLFYRAKTVVDCNDILYFYYRRKDSITGQRLSNQLIDRYFAFEQKLKDLKLWGMYDEYKMVLRSYYYKLSQDMSLTSSTDDSDLHEKIKNNIKKINKIVISNYGIELVKPYNQKYCYRLRTDIISKENQVTKIAIYGAGNVGKDYYNQLRGTDNIEVVVWVDANWFIFQKQGYPVEGIDELMYLDFEYVIIAIDNEEIMFNIASDLILSGIGRDKILCEKPIKIEHSQG